MKFKPSIAVTIALAFLFTARAYPQQSVSQARAESVTEITMERRVCLGLCPVDRVTFRPDGNHTYVGIRNVDRIGTHRPRRRDYVFEVMVQALERLNFFSLRGDYRRSRDAGELIISVRRGNETKVVKISGAAGESPIEMTILTAYIENVTSKIDWESVSDARP